MAVWLALALVLLVALGVYAAWTAGRLDRLHARLDAARAGLDAQLHERARVAVGCGLLAVDRNHDAIDLSHERARLENGLSRAIRAALDDPDTLTSEQRAELLDAVTRAGFARQFYNDAVRDALVLRRRRIVRLLHLFGRAPLPTYFEIDDVAGQQAGEISDVARASAPYD